MEKLDDKTKEIYCDKGREYISYCINVNEDFCPRTCRYAIKIYKSADIKPFNKFTDAQDNFRSVREDE